MLKFQDYMIFIVGENNPLAHKHLAYHIIKDSIKLKVKKFHFYRIIIRNEVLGLLPLMKRYLDLRNLNFHFNHIINYWEGSDE